MGETRPVTHVRGNVGHGLLVVHPGGPVVRSNASLHHSPHRTAQKSFFCFLPSGFCSCYFCLLLWCFPLFGLAFGVFSWRHVGVGRTWTSPNATFAVRSHCVNLAACRRHEKTPSEGPHRGKHTSRRPNKNGIVGSSLPRPHSTTRGVPVARSDAERTLLGMPAFYDILSMELLALIPTGGPKEVKAVSLKLDVLKKQ